MSIVIFDFDDTAFLVCVFLDVSVIINVPLAFASVAPVGVRKNAQSHRCCPRTPIICDG